MKKEKEQKENNPKPWTLKVALRSSGVLLVSLFAAVHAEQYAPIIWHIAHGVSNSWKMHHGHVPSGAIVVSRAMDQRSRQRNGEADLINADLVWELWASGCLEGRRREGALRPSGVFLVVEMLIPRGEGEGAGGGVLGEESTPREEAEGGRGEERGRANFQPKPGIFTFQKSEIRKHVSKGSVSVIFQMWKNKNFNTVRQKVKKCKLNVNMWFARLLWRGPCCPLLGDVAPSSLQLHGDALLSPSLLGGDALDPSPLFGWGTGPPALFRQCCFPFSSLGGWWCFPLHPQGGAVFSSSFFGVSAFLSWVMLPFSPFPSCVVVFSSLFP